MRVYDYSNYRKFLLDSFEEAQKRNPLWSISAWAKKMGLAGTASLSMVLNGKRRLGPSTCAKICSFFGFDAAERDYFEDLVELEACRSPRARSAILERLSRRKSMSSRAISKEELALFARWWSPVLLEAVRLPGFSDDPRTLKNLFGAQVEVSQLLESLSELKARGFLKQDALGRWSASSDDWDSPIDIPSPQIRRMHSVAGQRALRALETVPVERRNFEVLTVALCSKKIPELKELVREFSDKVSRVCSHMQDPDSVWQMNIQLFPVIESQKISEESTFDRQF